MEMDEGIIWMKKERLSDGKEEYMVLASCPFRAVAMHNIGLSGQERLLVGRYIPIPNLEPDFLVMHYILHLL